MEKFKKGDVVELEEGYNQMIAGTRFILTKDAGRYCTYIKPNGNTGSGYTWRFKLIKGGEKSMTNSMTEYTFRTKDIGMVQAEEIEVSREYPIALISSKGSSSIVVFHNTIVIKAKILKLSVPAFKLTVDNKGVIMCPDGKAVGKAVESLKSIIKAPWNCKGVDVTVKMLGVG